MSRDQQESPPHSKVVPTPSPSGLAPVDEEIEGLGKGKLESEGEKST